MAAVLLSWAAFQLPDSKTPGILSETGSAGDTSAALQTSLNAGVEAGSATNSVSATYVSGACSVAESANAVASQDGPSGTTSSVVETANAADTSNVIELLGGICAESGVAAQTASVTAIFAASCSEAASAVDSVLANRLVQVSWAAFQLPSHLTVQSDGCAETASAVETIIRVQSDSCSEAASAVDTASEGTTFVTGVINEAASAVDTVDSPAVVRRVQASWAAFQLPAATVPLVAEAASAASASSAGVVTSVSVAEAASATASSSTGGFVNVLLSWAAFQLPSRGAAVGACVEAASAADTAAVGSTLLGTTTDSWTIGDSVPSGINAQVVVQAEAASALDTTSAGSPTAAVAEAASALDAPVGRANYTGLAVAESGAAQDFPDISHLVSDAVLELSLAAESSDGSLGGTVWFDSVDEQANAVEANDGGAALFVIAHETAVPVEAATFQGSSIPGVCFETAVAAETSAGGNVSFFGVGESMSASDTMDRSSPPISASVTEAGAATDASGFLVLYLGSVAEGTASAADTAAVSALWRTFVTEAAAAVDDPLLAAQVKFPIGAEAANARDTTDGQNQTGTAAEIAAALDLAGATFVVAAAAAEAAVAVDGASSGGAFSLRAIIEAGLAVETINSTLFTGTVTEQGVAAEAATGLGVWAASVAELGFAFDSSDFPHQNLFGSAVETAASVDTSVLATSTASLLAETAHPVDSADAAGSIYGTSLSEVAAAIDVPLSGGETDVDVEEFGNAVDDVVLTLGDLPIEALWVRSGVSPLDNLWYRSASSQLYLVVRGST